MESWEPSEVGQRGVNAGDVGAVVRDAAMKPGWTLIWTLIDPVSCVSCVSSWYWVTAAETYETFHWESGMRYQRDARPAPRKPWSPLGCRFALSRRTQLPLGCTV